MGTAGQGPAAHAHTNRLSKEQSPYLLQHQHNPVSVVLAARVEGGAKCGCRGLAMMHHATRGASS